MPFDAELIAIAGVSKAWPFEEARKIVERLKKAPKNEVLFETGYGPSGLPHIGTFGEVARTSMVRHAFRVLTNDTVPTRLICFSDDMDGLRKVPDNVPNREMVAEHLGKPLTQVPDPFGTHPSFGAHNNARLKAFLDQFGFDYEFRSATDYYKSGHFDAALKRMLEVYDKVMGVMLPTLREERRATYSPFLPVCPRTGEVLQVAIIERDLAAATVTYHDPETGERVTVPVTGGHCKLQWKADWAMRWYAFGIDYEMAGKDLIDSVKASSKICAIMGGLPPEGFNYELFLDDKGEKISKSKGNGITIDAWLSYASPESLALYMYREPKKAKRLFFDVIPKNVDEYFQFAGAASRQEAKDLLSNPVWHIHGGIIPANDMPVSFALLLNLVSASNAENRDVLWGFIRNYAPGVTAQSHPKLDEMVGYAVRYFHDHVKPHKVFRNADAEERAALTALDNALAALPENADADTIQNTVYEIGRGVERYQDIKKSSPDGRPGVAQTWFATLYELLLGQEKGPRFGSFAALYGIRNTRGLIKAALEREGIAA